MPKRLSNEEKCNRLIKSLKEEGKSIEKDFQAEIKDLQKVVGHEIKQDETVYLELRKLFDKYKSEIRETIQEIITNKNKGQPPPTINIGMRGMDVTIKANEITKNYMIQKIHKDIREDPELVKKIAASIGKEGDEMIEIDFAELGMGIEVPNVSKRRKVKDNAQRDKRQYLYIFLGIGLIILLFYLLF